MVFSVLPEALRELKLAAIGALIGLSMAYVVASRRLRPRR
jgi:hypothetical protein